MNTVCTTKKALCKASQIRFAKLLGSLNASVAKLVDARDLKFFRSIVSIDYFCTTSSRKPMKYDAKSLVLHNGLGLIFMAQYQPKYKWRRTKIDENDVPTDSDWSGYDGEIVIGRIQKQPHGPMKGKWLWSAHGPRVPKRLLSHQGFEPEGREAMRRVEEYYDRLLAHNGLSPGVK